MSRFLALVAIAPLLISATLSLAQERPARPNGGDGVRLDFKDTELTDVIETIAKITGRNFLFDERVRGRVTVLSETDVTPEEAYRVFEAILQVKGFTTVEGPGGVLKIIPTRDAKEAPIETTKGSTPPENRDIYITRLLPLKFIKADAVATTFRPLVSKEANLIAYPPTNTLILSDTASNIRRLLTILAEIDVETYREQIKVIPLEYADAAELVGHLETIFASETAGSHSGAGRAAARQAARARRTQASQAAAQTVVAGVPNVAGDPRFIADDRTNSIIVLAPRGTISQVEKLVTLLDYQREGAGRIHVVRLQNADAEEMAATLASLADGGASSGRGVQGGGAQAVQSAVAQLQGGVRVTADAPTNSLIIQANAEGFGAIRDVISALDIRRPQVLVEALIMEVDIDDNEALGANWLFRTLFGTDDQLGGFSFGKTGLDPNGALSQSAGTFVGTLLGKTVNFKGVQLPVIEGLISATASNNDTNIISAPRLLTADNEEAQIVVGENIPIPVQQIQQPQTGGGSAPFQTSNSIERRDVGVTLRVTPQISEGDTVRLDIFQEISEVQTNSSNPDLGPDTTNRQVENTVYVRDGEAVMIGGILQENYDESETKVPFLGDIPILGWAFKSTSVGLRKTNLLIVLTPHIVRDPEDLQRLTVERREGFRHAARDALDLSESERAERDKAQAAGVVLPLDTNPVRRELAEHTRNYPTEDLPGLNQRHTDRERERLEEMEAALAGNAGSYRVQVSLFRTSADAVRLLQELIVRGYDGTVLARREDGAVLHTVQLGPYSSADRARAVAREVRSELDVNAIVVVEP